MALHYSDTVARLNCLTRALLTVMAFTLVLPYTSTAFRDGELHRHFFALALIHLLLLFTDTASCLNCLTRALLTVMLNHTSAASYKHC
jgi:hypothetical protein